MLGKRLHLFRWAAPFMALFGLGCHTPPVTGMPDLQLLPKFTSAQPSAASIFQGTPGILRVRAGGKAQLTIMLDAQLSPWASAFRLLALPTSWNYAAIVDLFSPTASTGIQTLTIPKAAFTPSSGSYTAMATFFSLRPAADYQARIYLQDQGGAISTVRLAGSQTGSYVLNAGPNTLTFNISINGNVISTIAGTGTGGYTSDGIPGPSSEVDIPQGVAVDATGDVYIADNFNHRIRKIDPSGTITTIAGTGAALFGGDGGAANLATVRSPEGVAVDSAGNVYISDSGDNRIRKINTAGIITTIAGNGGTLYNGDGVATGCALFTPGEIALDATGDVFIADYGNNRIRKLTPGGTLSTIAGNGTPGDTGDGFAATAAEISHPQGVAVDATGDVYIGDTFNNRVKMVNTSGIITTVAGTGVAGYSVDGVPATTSKLNRPYGVALDGIGDLFIADFQNSRIRKVDASGSISTVAGTGTAGYNGDGIAATAAQLRTPSDIALDAGGNLFIADYTNNRVRMVGSQPLYDVRAGSSVNNNVVTGNLITAGDTVTLDTGMTPAQPGVNSLTLYLYGPCYPGSSALSRIQLATLNNPATWQSYPWNTASDTVLPADFIASDLVGGAGVSSATGIVDVEAYDANNALVGKASFPIGVFGKPTINLNVK